MAAIPPPSPSARRSGWNTYRAARSGCRWRDWRRHRRHLAPRATERPDSGGYRPGAGLAWAGEDIIPHLPAPRRRRKRIMDSLRIADAARGLRHVFLRDMVLNASIGVFAHEQHAPQRIRINVDLAV